MAKEKKINVIGMDVFQTAAVKRNYANVKPLIKERNKMEEKIAEGRYFCMLYQYTDMAAQQKILYSKNPNSVYIAVDGPKNENKDDHILPTNTASGWTVTMISKNCKHPDRAIKFIDYLISEEGQKMVYLGVEGITYDMVDDKPVIKPDVLKMLNTDRASYDLIYGADDAYWMLQDNVMQLKWEPDIISPTTQLEEWTYQYAKYTGQYDVILPADTEDAYIDGQLKALWADTLQQLILAESDEEFDRLLEDYKIQRVETGFDSLQEKLYKYVVEAKKKLGIN
jgi:putative aldouronate transport system substrate-binding protein